MVTDELPIVIDVSLLSESNKRLPPSSGYNALRNLLNRKSNICWDCYKLGNRCNNVHYIFACERVKQITKNLKKEDYYEKP